MKIPKRKLRPVGYYAAVAWIVNNDDNEWLKDSKPIPSVTVEFLAYAYRTPVEKVIRDLSLMLGMQK